MVHDYHRRQYEQIYESTRELMDFMESCAGPLRTPHVLDVACGGGANIHHMSKRWPQAHFHGIDLDENLLAFARGNVPDADQGRVRYEAGDARTLPAQAAGPRFDITTFIHTLFLFELDEYPQVLQSLAGTGSRWIFISSLFTSTNMDVTCAIRDHARFGPDTRETITYTIADSARFSRLCQSLGAKDLVWKEFDIQIDLAPPAGGGLGTFTVPTAHGKRLQFSGAVSMPWRFVGLRMW